MIFTEETNNEIMRMNTDSIICENNQEFEFKSFSEEYEILCSYENSETGVKGGLRRNKRQDIENLDKRHYHL